VFVVVPLALVAGVVGTLVYVYVRLDLPAAPPPAQTTYIYDGDGNLLTTLHGEVDRTVIPLGQMPDHLIEAVLAVEDKDFYEHPGVSVWGTARAVWSNLFSDEPLQGGSTITQQYVKNVFTGGERSYSRKIKEAMLALKLEQQFTKDEILEKYLNTIYFGHGAYGVQAAAQTYWDKDAAELNVLESATLAGLINAPERFSPRTNPTAYVRRNYAIDRMADEGYITRDKAEQLKARPVQVEEAKQGQAPAAYFVTETKRWLENVYGVEDTFGGGFRVTTTLNAAWQRAAEEAVEGYLDPKEGDPSAALVAIDPRTGAIRAMVGDARHMDRAKVGLFNLATQAHRQTGSAFKPITLAAAMEDRISLDSSWYGPPQITIDDPRCETVDPETGELGPWTPTNAGDSGAGTMSLRSATAYSVNTIFAQLVVQVDPADVAEIGQRMGIESELNPVCSITLGSEDVTVLDMTTAYATLAARGVRHEPRYVAVVKSADGRLVQRPRPDGVRALDQNDADLVTDALQSVVDYGTGHDADIGRPVAGKTGTAHDATNAYFCGYIPQLVACVWVGFPQGQIPMQNIAGYPEVYGGTIPANIWHDFMAVATEGMPVEEFAIPSFEGYDQGAVDPPPPPSPTASPSPEPTESPSPTTPPPPSSTPPPTEPPPSTEPPPTTEPPTGGQGTVGDRAPTSAAWAVGAVFAPLWVGAALRIGRRRRRD
jgi:penicillin-binding protein 1A